MAHHHHHEDTSQAMDAVFMALGWRGRFQLLQLFQLLLCVFPLAFNILSIVFIGKNNEHKCRSVDNATSYLIPTDAINVTYEQCSVTWLNVSSEEKMEKSCPNGLEYVQPVDRSMMSEWDLVCENEALTDASQSLLLAGMMLGAVLFTSLADKYGRKPFHIACNTTLLVIGVATAFAPSFTAFLPLRFFLGAFQQGTGLTCGILCMEILPARHRFAQAIVGSFLWALGMVVLVFFAYLMQDVSWRYLQLLIACMSAYSLILIWTLDESLRWLVANGKVDHAEQILKKAAAQNKVNPQDVLNVFRTKALRQHADETLEPEQKNPEVSSISQQCLQELQASFMSQDKKELPKYGLLDFFRHKHVFMCVVINGFAWCVNAMTYYGLSMTSVSLADDMYLGFFLSAIVELPTAVAFIVIEKIGRKKCCDIFHVMAGLALLVSVALSTFAGGSKASNIAVIVLSLLGKFAISITFAVLFLYTPEQFPTNLRNASLGVASMTGRIGGMIAPYSRTLARHIPWGPGIIFGVFCLIMPFCMRMLPETCGRELPQTIEQMEAYISTPYKVSSHSKKEKESEVV